MIAFQSVFPPFRGGIATFSEFLMLHLAKQTTVVGFNFSQLYPSLLFPGKTQLSDEKAQAEGIQSTVHAYNPLQWSQAAKTISGVNPDVYLYSNWHPFFTAAQL
ncbi:MAG: hypothetical protein LAT57_02035, partial [Balneolales bacterium]|nr:hypothetical protein [Balneolales bacterium]